MFKKTAIYNNIKYNICVERFLNGNLQGFIWHCYIQQPIYFLSDMQMISSIEKEMNRLGYPQLTTEERNFLQLTYDNENREEKEVQRYMEESDVMKQKGQKATFIVEIKYRENSTWQGSVNWVEGDREEHFRSALELLRLMDNVGQSLQDTDT